MLLERVKPNFDAAKNSRGIGLDLLKKSSRTNQLLQASRGHNHYTGGLPHKPSKRTFCHGTQKIIKCFEEPNFNHKHTQTNSAADYLANLTTNEQAN